MKFEYKDVKEKRLNVLKWLWLVQEENNWFILTMVFAGFVLMSINSQYLLLLGGMWLVHWFFWIKYLNKAKKMEKELGFDREKL